MIIKKITIFLSLLFVFSKGVLANDYYVYVCAESEDEVALIKFDGKKAVVEKTIPVGVWPLEIEGPHGITVAPDGQHWYCLLYTSPSPRDLSTSRMPSSA